VRYFVAFISVLAGIAAVAVEFHLVPNAHLKKGSPEESRFVFDLCVTFYATVYLAGASLYAVIGRFGDRQELRTWSGWHMLVLHGAAFAYVFVPLISKPGSAPLLRPATIVTALLFLVSLIHCMRSITSRLGPGRIDEV
jgi:hypothetical protein